MRHPSRPILYAITTTVLCLAAVWPASKPASAPPDPGSAPARAGRSDADPCGTWKQLDGRRDGEHMVAAVRPPNGPQQVASAHFVVHYADDSLDTYAQSVSDAAERAYRVAVDTLSHITPVPDGTAGGDARIDIYLRDYTVMGSAYGTTYFGDPAGSPYPNSYTCWVELVDTMTTPRRVSVTAHEVYHTIHIAYDRFEASTVFEMLATWFQDRVYDQYNLHYDFARLFFRQPQRGLFSQFYTNVPWAIYLSEKYGDGILRETLEECAAVPGPNAREAFDAALQSVAGRSFVDEFIDFGTFNFFVAGRDDGQHYSEGTEYRNVEIERRSLCYPQELFVSIHPPAELGANYALLDGDGYSGPLLVRVYPEFLASSIFTMTRFKGATQLRTTRQYAAFSTPIDSIAINDWSECDSVLLVYQVNVGSSSNSFGFDADHRDPATPAGDWLLVLDRDGCRQPFNGFGDEFLDRDGEEHPIALALRNLGANVVLEDFLPADLSTCRGIFVVGGFDAGGVNLSSLDLTRLIVYMDAGGDVYVEGSRLGEFMDPSLGAGTAIEQDFWNHFSVSFAPGAPNGNLISWETTGNLFLGTHQFSYDTGSPNSFVGELTPAGNAGFLIRDDGGKVRASAVRATGGSSTRIMSTVLLGGSTGISGSTREAFLGDVLTLMNTNVAALAVARATVTVRVRDVIIEGVLEHYDERPLALQRVDTEGRHDVALAITHAGDEWRFSARDQLQTPGASYQLIDTGNTRVIWEERVSERTPDYTLRLTGIYPNPARGPVRIGVDSPGDGRATVGVYDVAGRLVSRETALLRRGSNVLFIGSLPATSGVYFVHIDAPGGRVQGRLLVLR